jgi:hypothetical protein
MNKTQQRAFGRKTIDLCKEFNLLTTKGRLLYLKPSLYRAVNTFLFGYINQSFTVI